jgi:hypothetical protein
MKTTITSVEQLRFILEHSDAEMTAGLTGIIKAIYEAMADDAE